MSLQSDPQQATRRELLLSIVVPVFNERTMLPVFLENLLPILQSLALKSEVVFVDDGLDQLSPLVVKVCARCWRASVGLWLES